MGRKTAGHSPSGPRVLLFTEGGDWHARRLERALAAEGLAMAKISLKAAGFAIGETRHGLLLPGFGDELPLAVIVRSVPAGTTEQITMRLSVLHALRELGVKVVNDARAIERCVDKSMTSFLIAKAGLPTPRTLVMETEEAARLLVRTAPGDVVVKPLFGSQGRGLMRVSSAGDLPPPETLGGVYYLQDLVRPGHGRHEDYRVFVVGGVARAAMRRAGESWITNIHQGAVGAPLEPEGPLANLAVAAADAVGTDYAGVDLIEDKDGRLLVLEVNSMPAWRGLFTATGLDMAEPIAAHVARSVAASAAAPIAPRESLPEDLQANAPAAHGSAGDATPPDAPSTPVDA